MKCYFTGEECDCGGQMDTECPHDEMRNDDLDHISIFDDDVSDNYEMRSVERQISDMSERLDGERVQNS